MRSMIWYPIEYTGVRVRIGSWKIIAISLPRISRRVLPLTGSFAMSTVSPLRCRAISPASIRPGGEGIRRRMLCAVTLLPQPLSPMTPTTCCLSTVKLTPLTARTTPSSVWKWVVRSRTSSRVS